MSFEIRLSENFKKEAKRLSKKYPSIKNEIGFLAKELSENPRIGISLGNDVYKIRLSIKSKGKGKSGGARVITFVKTDIETVMLLSIYSKGERVTLTDSEIKNLLKDFL
jgi:mRNA-degrading endonuclease RelE of RelBE toxin-antitoxin system